MNQAYAVRYGDLHSKLQKELDSRYKESIKENNFLRDENDMLRRNIDGDMKTLLKAYADLQFKAKEMEADNRYMIAELSKKEEKTYQSEVS